MESSAIQEKTFVAWVNQQLSQKNLAIENLTMDFADGTNLIYLVETLQGKTVAGKVYYNSAFEVQRLTNLQTALEALKRDGVKLVNIGPKDIADGNVKLILGLFWCLILRYQINGPAKSSPKKLLLAWLQHRLTTLQQTSLLGRRPEPTYVDGNVNDYYTGPVGHGLIPLHGHTSGTVIHEPQQTEQHTTSTLLQ